MAYGINEFVGKTIDSRKIVANSQNRLYAATNEIFCRLCDRWLTVGGSEFDCPHPSWQAS